MFPPFMPTLPYGIPILGVLVRAKPFAFACRTSLTDFCLGKAQKKALKLWVLRATWL